tara:strand:- start:374 stop:709 length:336 start_codon:yes stop_codon:yes gene_type:complete
MAQNFRQYKERNIGATPVDMPNGSNFDSYDCIVGIRLANTHTQSITVEAYITSGGANYYLIKNAPIPSGSSLELIDGGAKVVCISGDRLYIKSDTATSLDAIVSVVDAIST